MLYVCATPIGNLQDITERAIETFKKADIIACETIAETKKLMTCYGISSNYFSYREDNKEKASIHLIDELKKGKNVILVSDAGVPAISDPGAQLVDEALKNDIKVIPIPGASAVMSALSVSGFNADSFLFLGFLPRKNNKREKIYKEIEASKRTIVFFEAPHRILDTLSEIKDYVKERKICICREITKKFEEIKRDYIEKLIEYYFQTKEIKGEFSIVIEGRNEPIEDKIDDEKLKEMIKELLIKKIHPKEISKQIADKTNISKKYIYDLIIKEKNDEQ